MKNKRRIILLVSLIFILLFSIGTQSVFAADNHEHVKSGWIIDVESTCTAEGTKHIECTECYEVLKTESIPKALHVESDWTVDTYATCSQTGKQVKTCMSCGRITQEEILPKIEHSSTRWSIDAEATCTATGLQVERCYTCDEIVSQITLPKLDHDVSSWIIDKPATFTTEGHKYTKCRNCGVKIKEEVIPVIEMNVNNEMYETTLDLQERNWANDSSTTYSVDDFNGTRLDYVDKNGIVYDVSITNNSAVINAIIVPHATKRIIIPKTITLYAVVIIKDGLTSFSLESDYDKNYYHWHTPTPKPTDPNIEWDPIKAKYQSRTFTVTGVSSTFAEGTNLIEEVVLPDTVKTIDYNGFANNLFVKKIYAPSVLDIGSGAFYNCKALEYIYCPNILYIERESFAYCVSLKSFDFGNALSIDDQAFYNCTSLTYLKLPKPLQKLGTSVFDKCENLQKVDIPSGIAINTIEDGTFAHCTSLKEITFPYEIVVLGSNSFEHCDNLISIDFAGTNISRIESQTFYGCLRLEYVLLPESLLDFNTSAFDSCPSLRYVYFANELTENQISDIEYSNLAPYAITQKDTKGPLAVVEGEKTPAKTINISNSSTINIFDNVDVVDVKILYEGNVEIIPKKINSKFYGPKTKGYSFIPEEIGTYTITATDILGNTSTINVILNPQASKPASTTSIKATQTTSTIKLSWTAVPNATGYRIYKYDVATKKLSKITTTIKTTYTIKNLKAGTKYTYLVRAYTKSNGKTVWADYSAKDAFYTATKPSTSSKVTATQTTNTIKLTWNKVSGATGYRVYVYKNNKWTKLTSTTKTTYTIKNLKAGTTYKYAIKAYIKVNDAAIFADSFKTITTATKSATPTLKATAGIDKAALSWNKVTGATGYEVYYATSQNGTYKKLKTTTATSYTQNKLTTGKTYYFKVRTYAVTDDAKVYSNFSSVKSVKVK